jgi:hypothetical protein
MNGVIDEEVVDRRKFYVKFPCPFIQKRLFNHFARQLYRDIGTLYAPFTTLTHILMPTGLHIKNLLRLYEQYVQKNHTWLFQETPRRTDLRLYEAVYHFNLFMWLSRFLERNRDLPAPIPLDGSVQTRLDRRAAQSLHPKRPRPQTPSQRPLSLQHVPGAG